MGVPHLAVLEMHLFAQSRTETHDDSALDLGAQVRGVQDRAAFKNLANVADDDLLLFAVDGDFGAGGNVGAFFRAAGEAHPDAGLLFLYAFAPVESTGGFFEDASETSLFEMSEAELQWVGADGCGEFVHE